MPRHFLRLIALLLCASLPLCACNKDDDDDDEADEETTEAFAGYTLSDDEEKIPADD